MARTVSLRRYLPPLRFDVAPLARLSGDRLLPWSATFLPPEGPCVLILWRPGHDPAFHAHAARLVRDGRGWRVLGQPTEGWVVLHVGRDALPSLL